MNRQEIEERLTRYIQDELLVGNITIEPDEDLLESALLDSISIIQLVHFCEQELKVKIPHEDVTIENFASVELMGSYLTSRIQATH